MNVAFGSYRRCLHKSKEQRAYGRHNFKNNALESDGMKIRKSRKQKLRVNEPYRIWPGTERMPLRRPKA